jgi:hypothetical protein
MLVEREKAHDLIGIGMRLLVLHRGGLQCDIAIGEEEVEQLLLSLSVSSSSGTMEAEKGRGNDDWKAGKKKAGSSDRKETSKRIRKTMTPGPPSLKGCALRKPNRQARARGVGPTMTTAWVRKMGRRSDFPSEYP